MHDPIAATGLTFAGARLSSGGTRNGILLKGPYTSDYQWSQGHPTPPRADNKQNTVPVVVSQYRSDLLEVCGFIVRVNSAAHTKDARYRSTGSFYPDDIVARVIKCYVT